MFKQFGGSPYPWQQHRPSQPIIVAAQAQVHPIQMPISNKDLLTWCQVLGYLQYPSIGQHYDASSMLLYVLCTFCVLIKVLWLPPTNTPRYFSHVCFFLFWKKKSCVLNPVPKIMRQTQNKWSCKSGKWSRKTVPYFNLNEKISLEVSCSTKY